MRSIATDDIRTMPCYSFPEAAHYLRIPVTTLRSWVRGRKYPTSGGDQFFQPVIELPDESQNLLSFINLVEIHVLDAIRRDHRISLHKVRIAIDFIKEELKSDHPLAYHKLETDGLDLFVEEYGQLINVSQKRSENSEYRPLCSGPAHWIPAFAGMTYRGSTRPKAGFQTASQAGQLALRNLLQAHLRRIDRDSAGYARRLYPFTRKRLGQQLIEEPKAIVIDPRISFGRPVLAGTGIPTAIIAERYKAGEAIGALADDYDRPTLEIEEAIRCELYTRAA